MLCCEECPATDVHSVLRRVISDEAQNVLMCKFDKFYICAVVGIIIE